MIWLSWNGYPTLWKSHSQVRICKSCSSYPASKLEPAPNHRKTTTTSRKTAVTPPFSATKYPSPARHVANAHAPPHATGLPASSSSHQPPLLRPYPLNLSPISHRPAEGNPVGRAPFSCPRKNKSPSTTPGPGRVPDPDP